MEHQEYYKGRGAQLHVKNPFLKQEYVTEHIEGIDEHVISYPNTQIFYENSKKIVNAIDSPDLGMMYSLNPYQGCEHGCIYCYARNSHQYWGLGAGMDFETKIIVKKNAPSLLEKTFQQKSWRPQPISLSGNTDCYQPIEHKLQITRSLLKIFLKYGNPVSIITKNSLVKRDMDVLKDLADEGLAQVFISVTTLQKDLREKMEPRTASVEKRLDTMAALSAAGIPVAALVAPIIPGLNNHEIPELLKKTADAGALSAGYTIVRLNGSIGQIFEDWLYKNFPDKAAKVWNQIKECHGGNVNDSEWGRRMKGDGPIALAINSLFKASKTKYFKDRHFPSLHLNRFRPNGNLSLF